MYRNALLFPVLAGMTMTDVRRVADLFAANMDEYRRSRARAGLTLERVYAQSTPAGMIVIAYVEGSKSFGEVIQLFVTSDLGLDRQFLDFVRDVHGVDIRKPPAGPPPETIAAWADPNVTVRRTGTAFVAPALPGKADALKAWAHEAFVTRSADFAASRRALGQDVEVITINYTPMGEFGAVYLEGNDPVEANRRFAASQTPYDRWFKDALKPMFPPQIDFDQPVPPAEQFWDYVAQR